jgi:ribosomal protein L12E/L44/L45/RPP1/RPP2
MIPPEDKEERPVQKIEKFTTFLNEIPWFSEDEDGEPSNDESMLSGSTAGVKPDEMREDLNASMLEGKDIGELARNRAEGYAPLGQSVELQLMKGAGDNEEDFGRALEAAELKRSPISSLDTNLFQKAELGKQLTEAPDPKDRDAVMNWQLKLKQLGYDLGNSGPNKDGIDGVWGGKTKAAYNDWYSKKWGK